MQTPAGRRTGRPARAQFPALRCLPKWKPTTQARRRTEMGKIIVSENVSLDGIVQDPVGDEGFRHGGWFGQYGGKDLEEWGTVETEEALAAEALLLGRRTD